MELVRSPSLSDVAQYAWAAVVERGTRLVFAAGACPLDEQGNAVESTVDVASTDQASSCWSTRRHTQKF